MKSNLFDPESWLWKPFGRIADFILLSALWLLCSLPLVTAGPAFCAMYDCCARCVLGKEGGMTARFFRTFRRELGLGIGSLLLWGAVLGLGLGILRTFTSNATGTDANVILAGSDPADLGENYGKACAALGNLWPRLEEIFVIRRRDIKMQCDFESTETKMIARLDISITIGRLLGFTFRHGTKALREFLKIMKKRKGGAAA